MMDNNDDLTIAARVKGWEVFAPDWAYLLQRTSLPLVSLCALSVGLHPAFADPSWVFHIAMQHFSGADSDECCPLEDAEEGAKRAALLNDFIRRVNIAVDELAPRGGLTPIEGADGLAILRIADFATWATGKGWSLPDEFARAQAAAVTCEMAPGVLQNGGGKNNDIKGCTKAEIKAANWPGDVNWNELLSRSVPNWLLDTGARVCKGQRGGQSALWNPSCIAVGLHTQRGVKIPALDKVMRDSFPEYLGDWNEAKERL
jgi:hypothetical protein